MKRFKNFKMKLSCIRKIMAADFYEVLILDQTGFRLLGRMPEKVVRPLREAIEDVMIQIKREAGI